MAFQLEFAEERALQDTIGRHVARHKGPATEMRRAYDALIELAVVGSALRDQVFADCKALYLEAFQAYNRGDIGAAELLARGVRHICRGAWFDAKISFLEKHSEEFPHVPGLSQSGAEAIGEAISELENRFSRLRLTGMANRVASQARQQLDRLKSLPDRNKLLADTLIKSAYELCLATEALHELELRRGVSGMAA